MPSRGRAITAKDLTALTVVADPQMSPDGRWVLFTRKTVGERNQYHTALWLADAEGKAAPRQLTHGTKDSFGRWSPDGSSIAFIRADAEKPTQIALLETGGGEARVVTALPEGSVRDLAWSPCGTRVAYSFRPTEPEWTKAAAAERAKSGATTPARVINDPWYRLDGDGYFGGQRYALHLLHVATGRTQLLFDRDSMGTFTYAWSPDSGALVVAANVHPRALWEPEHERLYVVVPGVRGHAAVSELPNQPEGPKTRPAWSPDGMQIAYAGRRGTDSQYSTSNLELWCYDLRRKRARCLTSHTDYCMMAATLSDSADATFEPQLRWMPDSQSLLVRIGWHGSGHVASVDAAGKGPVVFHTSAGQDVSLGTLCARGLRLACVRMAPTAPPEVHALEVVGTEFPMRRLTGFNDAFVRRVHLVQPEERWVKAKDGAKVQAWIMRPAGKRRRGPAVLEIHGGPHAQYGLAFFHEFQLLCANGYTVWFSNPRGSKGYGQKHCEAIRGAWGTKDWVDIQAVTAAMQRDPGTDPRRMGVMGGSYGGYMTNWAIGHTHVFAGAITDRCVSNMVSMCGNSDYIETPNRYWKGAVWHRPEALWRASPIAHFRNVRTPTLVIHSEGDLRCNVEQGEQVYAALCTLGVPARLVRYPRETSHGMSRAGPPDMRLHRLGQILEWWAHWLH